MNPFSIFLLFNMTVGVIFGILVLIGINKKFGNYQGFVDDFIKKSDASMQPFMGIISKPLSLFIFLTLLGLVGIIGALMLGEKR